MTETKTQTPAVLTPEFRGMYVHLFETQEADNGSKFYSIEALFSEGADLSRLKADATRAVKERWGADPAKWPKNLRSPFRDQGDFDKEGYTPGAQLCRFKRLADFGAPGVVDASAQSIIDPAQVYSGAYYRATVRAFASAGVDPQLMGTGPITAVRKVLEKAKLSIDDIGLIEANEAFSAQALCVARALKLNPEITNISGGAVGLGHPIGASGCRLLVTLLYGMKRLDKHVGLATLCIGGGQGIAMVVER